MSNKLRVLYLVNVPSPYRVSFFNELGKLCDLTVLFERKASSERDIAWHDYNFENFKGVFLRGINFGSDQAFSLGYRNHIKYGNFDHIIVGGYSTPTGAALISYLKLKGIPFILNIDGGMIKENENKIKGFIKRHYISSANAWLSTGKVGSEYLEYYGANSENIYIYPFTTLSKEDVLERPTTPPEKKQLRKKLGLPENKIVVTVGQFVHRKGFDVLIEAWSQVSGNASLYLIGGEPTKEYESLIKKHGIHNINFIEFMSKYELQKYYRAADLFVLPTREDIWGLVINEAMASGLPVITTNKCVAGLELVTDYENGFIVPVGDVNILSERINETLSDENLLVKMSENSLTKSEKYTIENMATVTIKILRQIYKSNY